MPQVSDYECQKCKKVFENWKNNINECFPSEIPCVECGGVAKHRISKINISIGKNAIGNGRVRPYKFEV
jgi:hypothetical protein